MNLFSHSMFPHSVGCPLCCMHKLHYFYYKQLSSKENFKMSLLSTYLPFLVLLHSIVYQSGFFREIGPIEECVSTQRLIWAVGSQNWGRYLSQDRPSKADGVDAFQTEVWEPSEAYVHWWLRARADGWHSTSRENKPTMFSTPFALCRLSMGWTKSAHTDVFS